MIDDTLLTPTMAWLLDKQLDTYTKESMAIGGESSDNFAQKLEYLRPLLGKREHFSSDCDL
jgi:hypothetical protein